MKQMPYAARFRPARAIGRLGLSLLAAVALASAFIPSAEAGPEVVTVDRSSIAYATTAGGKVAPRTTTDLYFSLSVGGGSGGRRVAEVAIETGQRVSAGDLLVRLDGADIDERVANAEEAASEAAAGLARAQEAARQQAAQAAQVQEAAAGAAGQAAEAQADAAAQGQSCAAKAVALANTAFADGGASGGGGGGGGTPTPPPPGGGFSPATQAALDAVLACQAELAAEAGEAGGSSATARMLAQQAAALRSGGSATAGASSRLDAANRSVEQARRQQQALELFAPYDGVITAINATRGSLLVSGSPAATIRSDELVVRAELVEGDLIALKPGASAAIRIEGAAVEAVDTIETLPKDPARSSGGLSIYPLDLPIPQSDRLRSGQSARVRITVETHTGVLVVPTTAVGGRGTDTYVTVVTSRSEQRRRVVPGISNEASTEILDGLSEGEQIRRFAR